MLKSKEYEETIILTVFGMYIWFVIDALAKDIYIWKFDIYLKADYLKNFYFSALILVFLYVFFTTSIKYFLIKILYLHIPIFFVFLLHLLNFYLFIGIFICILSIFAVVLYLILYLIYHRHKKKQIQFAINRSLTIFVVTLFLVIPAMSISKYITTTATTENVEKNENDHNQSEKIKNDLNILINNLWNQSSEIDKLNCLQTLINFDSYSLGIKSIPKIESRYLDGIKKGQFNTKENIIQINKTFLNEGETYEIIETALHELRHKYQSLVLETCNFNDKNINLLLFYSYPRLLKEAREQYPDENSSPGEEYYYNFAEINAREYAEEKVEEYKELIFTLSKSNI